MGEEVLSLFEARGVLYSRTWTWSVRKGTMMVAYVDVDNATKIEL